MAVILLVGIYTSACSTTQNYASVRSYPREISVGNKYYVVKQGDTLYSISFRAGVAYQRLASWNSILPPYKIEIGQKIKLFEQKQWVGKKNKKIVKKTTYKKKRTPSQKKIIVSKKTSTNSKANKKLLKLLWKWPIKGRLLKRFSKTSSKGIDISGKAGQKVKAAASGKVVYSGSGLKGYGNLLIIKHNYLYLSAYANNRRLLVKEGQFIKKGQVIAEVGQVGSKQTSLHFEIRKNGNPVNPLNYLPKK
jgi:lipoprotein NlpD